RYCGANDGSQEWVDRAKGWLRVMRVDAWVSMVVYTFATIAFYLLGAAVLHAKNLEVTDEKLIQNLSHIYLESFGSIGLWLFLIGAFVVLYSTVFIATASNGRLVADFFRLMGWIRLGNETHRTRIVTVTCVSLP